MPGRRPERVRMKSRASISTRSPSTPCAELAAGGTVEHELERLAVDGGPLGDDVGDEAAVVIGA